MLLKVVFLCQFFYTWQKYFSSQFYKLYIFSTLTDVTYCLSVDLREFYSLSFLKISRSDLFFISSVLCQGMFNFSHSSALFLAFNLSSFPSVPHKMPISSHLLAWIVSENPPISWDQLPVLFRNPDTGVSIVHFAVKPPVHCDNTIITHLCNKRIWSLAINFRNLH